MKSIDLCKVCKKEYVKMHSRHFYCSIACKRIANPQKKPFIVSCTNCGKNASFTRAYYLRKKNSEKTIGYFCSKTCEGKYRTKISRDVRTCEFCKKSFVCKKGNKLRFCSTKCQSKWQKVTNSGKNHPSYNHNVPDELRIKKCGSCGKEMFLHPKEFEKKVACSRKCLMKMQNKTNTKPHRIVKGILEKNKIKNTPEHRISNYFIDIFIRKTNLLIEVNGEWWHTSPRLDKKKRKEEMDGKKGLKKIGQKILFLSLKNTKYFTYGKMIHITQ